jgi:hypothetical protein
MENMPSILSKINALSAHAEQWSAIEKDLALQYTRDLYEAILSLHTTNIEVNDELIDSLQEDLIAQDEVADIYVAVESPIEEDTIETEDITEEEEELEDKSYEEELYSDDMLEFEVQDMIPDEIILDEPIIEEDEGNEDEKDEENIEIVLSNPDIPHIIEVPTPPIPQVSEFKLWHKDIRTYIGINDKYNFISELFHNNAEAYEEVLHEINKCENKAAAFMFLEQAGITTLYQWDTEGFSAQVFYNVLNQFFATK